MFSMKSLYCIDLQVLQKETDADKNEQKNGNEILEPESTQTSYSQTIYTHKRFKQKYITIIYNEFYFCNCIYMQI